MDFQKKKTKFPWGGIGENLGGGGTPRKTLWFSFPRVWGISKELLLLDFGTKMGFGQVLAKGAASPPPPLPTLLPLLPLLSLPWGHGLGTRQGSESSVGSAPPATHATFATLGTRAGDTPG